MAFGRAERVAQNIRAKARTAHAEQDHVRVRAAVAREVAELLDVLEHLLRDAQPSKAVANLIALGGVARPQRRVLGPQPSRRVVLLQLRQPRIDRRLQRRQRVPLARALADANLRALLLQRVEQALEGLGERLHALDLELARHLVEVDARLRELLQLPLREVDVLVQAAAYLAVLAERSQRRGRNGVDSVGADQLLDVVGVGIARVFGRRARPQAALRACPGFVQLVPARTAEVTLEVLVSDFRVGDGGLAVQALEVSLLRGVGRVLDLLGQQLVDLRVDAADEKARNTGDLAEIAAIPVQLLEA